MSRSGSASPASAAAGADASASAASAAVGSPRRLIEQYDVAHATIEGRAHNRRVEIIFE